MHPRLSWIEQEGKKILLQDYTGLLPDDAIKVMHEFEAVLSDNNMLNLRSVINVKGLYASKDLVYAFKVSAKEHKHRYDKLAIIGLDGIKRMFLKTIKQFSALAANPFSTKEEAMAWLTKD